MSLRKLIAGNWKMNGTSSDLDEIAAIANVAAQHTGVDVAICTPATLIERAATACPSLGIGGQDIHAKDNGAHTGCVSAPMLVDAGARLSIVGHSERRADQHEGDADVRAKAEAGHRAGLGVIVCVGETEAQRDAGEAIHVVRVQLDGSVPHNAHGDWLTIAYEPIWAIGTGRIPSAADVGAMHDAIRARLVQNLGDAGETIRILYGGSMNGANAAELLAIPNVDGGLVGGASLTADKFAPIIEAAARA